MLEKSKCIPLLLDKERSASPIELASVLCMSDTIDFSLVKRSWSSLIEPKHFVELQDAHDPRIVDIACVRLYERNFRMRKRNFRSCATVVAYCNYKCTVQRRRVASIATTWTLEYIQSVGRSPTRAKSTMLRIASILTTTHESKSPRRRHQKALFNRMKGILCKSIRWTYVFAMQLHLITSYSDRRAL